MFAIITPKSCLIDELKTSTKWMDIKKVQRKKEKRKKKFGILMKVVLQLPINNGV
jgi:hypothetical protein